MHVITPTLPTYKASTHKNNLIMGSRKVTLLLCTIPYGPGVLYNSGTSIVDS